jgi:selenocysteine lyase/cysteine desulfurase
MGEVKDAAVRTFAKIREARDAYEQALADKAPAKERAEKLRALHYAIENSGANMHYAAKVLVEHTENVVQKARADIEAMVAAEATRLGLTSDQAQGLLELPVLEGEVTAEIE